MGSKLCEDRAVTIMPPAEPWAFGAVVALASDDLFQGSQSVVLEFDALPATYGVGILGDGPDYLIRVEAPGTDARKEMWLNVTATGEPLRIVIQNWGQPSTRPAVLRKVWLVRDTA